MKALYRKYRPTTLEQVIGQEQVTVPLKNALKQGKISHAYLFTGPRGCGKTSVARIFAHEINHFKYEIEDSYVDIIEIDAASNTGVDNIRELREKSVIAPSKGKYKVYIIDEVHMLTKAAFNALLKTLEEPPESVVFIMATTDAYKVPITITSRSQVYNFQLASPDIMQKHLQKIAKAENIKIDDEALNILVQKGGGSFRDSISLLDQISALSSEKITKEVVLSALGLPDQLIIDQLLAAYEQGNYTKITKLLKTELDNGSKPEILAENLIRTIINRPKPELLPLLEKLPDVKNPFPEAKLLLAFLENFSRKIPRQSTNNSPELTKIKKPIGQTIEKSIQLEDESSTFDCQSFIENVKSANSAIGAILEKCELKKEGNTLKIILERKTHRVILSSTNNQNIMQKFLPENTTIELHDSIEKINKSKTLSKISDIMGAVTEANSSGNPFD